MSTPDLRETAAVGKKTQLSPVCSYNEWDPLEEVIVGIIDDASFPTWHMSLPSVLPADQVETFRSQAGRPFPPHQVEAARRELEGFVHILEGEGVTVRRPEPIAQRQVYSTLDWASTGLYAAMPRDALLVVGNEIIECPMAWRSRYYESLAYRPLLKGYFRGGAQVERRPEAGAHRRAVRPDVDRLRRGRSAAAGRHRVRADVRRGRLHPVRPRHHRPEEQRHQRFRHRVAPPPTGR